MPKNQESTTYRDLKREDYPQFQPTVKAGERPVVYGSPELVRQGPQPEAHKSIHDYRDQLAAKRRRKRGL